MLSSLRGMMAVVGVMMVVVVVGCSGGGGDNMPESLPAREQAEPLVDFVAASADQLGLVGWWPGVGPAYADECSPGRVSYQYTLMVKKGSDPIGDTRTVAAYWESLGMATRIVDPERYPRVYAEGGPVVRASFTTLGAEDTYRIIGVMPCGEGDAIALNDEAKAIRDRGGTVPGWYGAIPYLDTLEKPPL